MYTSLTPAAVKAFSWALASCSRMETRGVAPSRGPYRADFDLPLCPFRPTASGLPGHVHSSAASDRYALPQAIKKNGEPGCRFPSRTTWHKPRDRSRNTDDGRFLAAVGRMLSGDTGTSHRRLLAYLGRTI
jgi:hypothetical protein